MSIGAAAPVFADYKITTLVSLGSDGDFPQANLVLSNGIIYGTTGSSVFSVPVTGGTPTTLASFGGSSGANPGEAGLILSGGTLYGTTISGGNLTLNSGLGYGTVFSVPTGGGSPTTLASFDGSNGANPQAGVVLSGGTLYGTTQNGGVNNSGAVFSVPAAGGAPTPIASFDFSGSGGWLPLAGLVLSGGLLYGTAADGGTGGGGTVFSVPISGGGPSVLGSFNGTDGLGPDASLILSGGTLYGTTAYGGKYNDGTVFSLPVTGGTPTVLASFNGTDGATPVGSLLLSGGTLYGTTSEGGNLALNRGSGYGAVFSVPVTGGTPTVLASFNGTNGTGPVAGLVSDANGNLYGTTSGGGVGWPGQSDGTVFELSPIAPVLTWNNAGATGDGKTWDVGVNQNWNHQGNPTVFSQYDNITFNDTNNGNYNVTLNTIVTPATVTFANYGGNYTISGVGGIGGAASLTASGSAQVTLNTSNTYSGPTTVAAGTLVIGAASALPFNTAVTIGGDTPATQAPAELQLADGIGDTAVSSLIVNPGATFDITDNALAINFGTAANDPAASIRSYLQSGYNGGYNDNGGSWLGPGIDSTAAALNPGRYAVGYADGNVDQGTAAGPNQILVEYTLAGDANLDGTVNFADLLVVAQNFNHTLDTHGNPMDWADGDFNYDGKVNFADLLIVAQNFNQTLSAGQLEQLPGSFSAAWNLALAEVQASESNNVPEPASVGILGIAGVSLLARRRRN
jgi:uncharacterized repeat protein (TIGR03803 family)/autotransporter-associated beta strand protein